MTLVEIYESLRQTDRDGLIALPTAEGSPHRLARGPDGHIMVLFATAPEGTRTPPLQLANLRLDFNRTARLIGKTGEREEGSFAIIECLSDEPAVVSCFLDVMETLLQKFPTTLAVKELRPEFNALLETFRRLTESPTTSALGIWGELFIIAESSDPIELIKAWHNQANQLVDFATEYEWVEVKTSAGEERQHFMSLRQVSPPSGVKGYLVSLTTIPVSNGVTIKNLMDRIQGRIRDDSSAPFGLLSTVVAQLGREYEAALGVAFDEATARESVRIFAMDALPKIPGPIPPEIRNIRFTLDLTAVQSKKTSAESKLIHYIRG